MNSWSHRNNTARTLVEELWLGWMAGENRKAGMRQQEKVGGWHRTVTDI